MLVQRLIGRDIWVRSKTDHQSGPAGRVVARGSLSHETSEAEKRETVCGFSVIVTK